MKKITINHLKQKKKDAQKITMLTAYDVGMAKAIDRAGVDIVFIGDSCGNVFAGKENTLSVTMDQMIYHTQAVKRGVSQAMVLTDMPFLSYHISERQTKENAGRLIHEGGAEAIKVEVNPDQLHCIEAIIKMGIPVMGHIGFTPQSVHQLGGYKIQGKTEESAKKLIDLAQTLDQIGAFAIVLEMVPEDVSKTITETVSIPTIGIGAGRHCDGQVLVTHDVLGMSGFKPKFVKQYAQLEDVISNAIAEFKSDVESGDFPTEDHSY